MKADSSPIVNSSNLRSDTHEASAERTPPNLHPVPRPKSPSIDRRNGRHRSPSNTGVAAMKAPLSSPAKNDGVVLFFDGICVDQVDWWIGGLEDLTSSIFVSSPTKLTKALQVIMNKIYQSTYQHNLPLVNSRFGRPRKLVGGKSTAHYIFQPGKSTIVTLTRTTTRKRTKAFTLAIGHAKATVCSLAARGHLERPEGCLGRNRPSRE